MLVLAAEEGFTPPGVGTFIYPPIPGLGAVTKPVLMVALSAIIIAVYFVVATRRLALVPNRSQFVAESFYGIARNTMARDQIGGTEFLRYVPLILGLFSFVLVNNLFGIIPLLQFPTMSRIGFPLALALYVYVFYHYAGFRKHGFVGYFKHALLPPGAPTVIYLIIAPIEFLQKFIVQPLALAIRVFAAMFAGHLILVLFAVAAEFLLSEGGVLAVAGPLAGVAAVAFTFLEALVMVIQAYIFALLAAVFTGAAISEDH